MAVRYQISLPQGRIPPRLKPVPKGNSYAISSRACLALYYFCAVPALAQKRNITEKDLFNFVWAGDTQISPDGSRVAFVRVTVNQKKDGYDTAIWSVLPQPARHIN